MNNILFASSGRLPLSSIARLFASSILDSDKYNVYSINVDNETSVYPGFTEVMREVGCKLTYQKGIKDKPLKWIDLLIYISSSDDDHRDLFLAGYPTRINLPHKSSILATLSEQSSLDEYRLVRDELEKMIQSVLSPNYLQALLDATMTNRFLLNSLGEGIIAHDVNRKITFFNRAAEEITGYSCEEVIGRDCHDVFPGNFCGLKCAFCTCLPKFDSAKYNTDIFTKGAGKKNIEMSVKSIKGRNNSIIGVLASFRDRSIEAEMESRLKKEHGYSGIIGKDPKMLEVFDLIKSVSDSKAPVLVYGASGTGKELVASAIHNESYRCKERFITVNCGAIPETLLESELFGHVKGAFTGAIRDKKGRFELADKGTIFLDEIGDISQAMQVKLLRVLQEGTFERVGGEETVKVDVRVISATNKDLRDEIRNGNFREDLFYRLSVVPVNLPELKERKGDIPLLARYLLKKIIESDNLDRQVELSSEALSVMVDYDWPGNIREMQNWIQFALIKSAGKSKILPEHFPNLPKQIKLTSPNLKNVLHQKKKLDEESVREALVEAGGNKAKTAKLLKVSRATLYRFLDSL